MQLIEVLSFLFYLPPFCQNPVEEHHGVSTQEILDPVLDESWLLNSTAQGLTSGESVPDEECEVGCDALEVFGLSEEPLGSKADDGEHAIPVTDDGNCEPAEVPSDDGKKTNPPSSECQNLGTDKPSCRHSSVTDSDAIADEFATATSHLSAKFPRLSPLPLLPRTEDSMQMLHDDPDGNTNSCNDSKFKEVGCNATQAQCHDDAGVANQRHPPRTAPPIMQKQNEFTFMDRMNRKLFGYIKGVRATVTTSVDDGHKKGIHSRLIKVIDLTSDKQSSSASVVTMTYADILLRGMWFCSVLVLLLVLLLVFAFILNDSVSFDLFE